MTRRQRPKEPFDAALADWPLELRWREWLGRIEAVLFAAPEPVPRAVLVALVGPDCRFEDLIADLRLELRGRPYDLVAVASGFHLRTRPRFADAIRAAGVQAQQQEEALAFGESERLTATAIAYLQPVTRAELGRVFGHPISRDAIARLKRLGVIGPGPRSPEPGAPLTYVTTPRFLSLFGLASLRDLPDVEALEEAGLLARPIEAADFDRTEDDDLGDGVTDDEAA